MTVIDTRPQASASGLRASYPTRSLRFLEQLQTGNGTFTPHFNANKPLQLTVVVIGAGIGGLSTAVALALAGHKVKVLEQASALAEVGAGIQIPPNSTRLLFDWGLGPLLYQRAVEPESMTFRRWQDGTPIARTDLGPGFRSQFHAPYFVIHRAHFHQALHERALELGVEVILDARVEQYDVTDPAVITQSGETIPADLVVAADGINSSARWAINGESKGAYSTGLAAYRATVDVELMRHASETAWLLEKPGLHIWIGPNRHAMTYTIAGGKQFNMVLVCRDSTDPSTWNRESVLKDMQAEYEGWDPSLTKTLALISQVQKWPLLAVAPQDRWVSESGKMVMLGDAAHAMVPFMSQAMAVEDAAALAEVLRSVHVAENIPDRLRVFEQVRRKRTDHMQEASWVNGILWHFHDGAEQQARDKASRAEVLGQPFEESSNQWSDPVTKKWAYGYDAVAEIREALICKT